MFKGNEKKKLEEIREHLITYHFETYTDQLIIRDNPKNLSVDVCCCGKEWRFSKGGHTVNSSIIETDRLAALINEALTAEPPTQAGLNVNPIADLEL